MRLGPRDQVPPAAPPPHPRQPGPTGRICVADGRPYLVGQVEGGDAQRPEAAEHGEDAEAQVVPRGHHEEVVLALRVAGVVTLPGEADGRTSVSRGLPPSLTWGSGPPSLPGKCRPRRKRKTQGWALGCSREINPTAQWTSGMGCGQRGVHWGRAGGSTQAGCGVHSLF